MNHCLIVLTILLVCFSSFGDTLVTKEGQSFTGQVVSQDREKVVFEVTKDGGSTTMTFKVTDVASIAQGNETPAKPPMVSSAKVEPASQPTTKKNEGPCFYVIPIKEEIGLHVTAELIENCLKDASKYKPDVIVLDVESGGGSVDETIKIAELLANTKTSKIIAIVEEAGSAAAIISMACEEIYMKDGAIMGSALAIQHLPWGITTEVEEKYQSFWRARCRAIAERAGHQGIIAEAMIDKAVDLHIVPGEKRVEEGSGPQMLKRHNRILTLTANEAVNCGLAKSIANNFDELGKFLGYESWSKIDSGEKLYDNYQKDMKSAIAALSDLAERYKKVQKLPADSDQQIASRTLSEIKILHQVKKLAEKYPRLRISKEKIEGIIKERAAYYKEKDLEASIQREKRTGQPRRPLY